jgi:hypothetical protein
LKSNIEKDELNVRVVEKKNNTYQPSIKNRKKLKEKKEEMEMSNAKV